MSRQTGQQLAARRHEVANHFAHCGWAQAPPERLKLEIPECAVTDSFRYDPMLRNVFGVPPWKELAGLRAEHYAALAAEHERDPYLHELRRKESERDNPTAPDGAEGRPLGTTKYRYPRRVTQARNCHFRCA